MGSKGKPRRDAQQNQPRTEPQNQNNARRKERAAQRHNAAADALRGRAPSDGGDGRPQEARGQPNDPTSAANAGPSSGWFK